MNSNEEQQLRYFASIGRHISTIAHDLKNILSVISIHGGAALERCASDPETRKRLDEIIRAKDRAFALVQTCLTHARIQPAAKERIDLTCFVKENRDFFESLIGAERKLVIYCDDAPAWIYACKSQLFQIFLNLIANSRDSTEARGRVAIEIVRKQFHSSLPNHAHPISPGEYIQLTIRDNGAGMDSPVLKNLFKCSQTSKPDGQGTGLGLSIVHQVALEHSAGLFVESSVNQGTAVTLTFPESTLEKSVEAKSAPVREPGNVVIIDDNEDLRVAIQGILELRGFKVQAFANADQALEALKKDPTPLDLAVSDVAMPGMKIAAFVQELKRMSPQVRLLFISGYPLHVLEADFRLPSNQHFLEKPFEMAELVRKITSIFGP